MISVTITVNSDERGNLTDFERGVFNALSGLNVGKVTIEETGTKVGTKGDTKDKVVDKVTTPTQDELPGDEGPATMDTAVKRATELVANGKAAEVKAALATAGVKRVSELKGKAIAAFLEALDA